MRTLPPISEMPVVILCGGQGTRIRDVTESVPKPLIDIGGEPILWHIMKLYGHYGARRFVLCLGYKSWLIKDYFLRYREHLADFRIHLGHDHEVSFLNRAGDEDWEVTCLETGLTAGTGARLHRVADQIDTDTFLFTYGDGLGSVDIKGLVDFHASHDKLGTVTGVHPTSRYGEMRIAGDAVAEFNEKPTVPEGRVSGGFFVFDRGVLDYLPDDEGLMLESEPLQKLARDGQLMMWPHDGFWMGMDTYREYTMLNALWARDEAPWKVWGRR
jgi:glucose-1-phosphate cytidylyltransferase